MSLAPRDGLTEYARLSPEARKKFWDEFEQAKRARPAKGTREDAAAARDYLQDRRAD
jgi:hypothetical protein